MRICNKCVQPDTRPGIVFDHEGKIIEESDLTFKRPAHGISPKLIDKVVGKTAVNDISEDMVMQWDMLV